MRSSMTSRLFVAATAALAAWLSAAPPASAEPVTPQAAAANAEFLAWAPPPPVPVKVCVVDTGVDLTTDAASAVVERYSEWGGTVDDTGGSGVAKHGTYVAGTIASQPDGRGSVGIWPHAKIVSDRVFPDRNSGTTVAKYLQALNRCRAKGAKVVNLSLSGLSTATGPELAELENRIVDLRLSWDVNVVAAAGNNASDVGYPARFPSVFAVGASDSAGSFCDFSSRGPELDISTLGCGIELSLPTGVLGLGNGTSYSAPVVSGVLAALRAYRPDLTASAAEDLLTNTSRLLRAGEILDADTAFRQAGLGDLVARAQPPSPSSPALATADVPARSVVEVVSQAPGPDPLEGLGIRPPRVRRATYRHGVLRVAVAGASDISRVIFAVDGRRYARTNGTLRLKLRRPPKSVSVFFQVRGVGRTAAVRAKIRHTNERGARSGKSI
jgi:hypothetical protein